MRLALGLERVYILLIVLISFTFFTENHEYCPRVIGLAYG